MTDHAIDVVRATMVGNRAGLQEALLDHEVLAHDGTERTQPVDAMLREERLLPGGGFQRAATRQPRILERDQLAAWIAGLGKLVRIHQAQIVIAGIREDGGEQVHAAG